MMRAVLLSKSLYLDGKDCLRRPWMKSRHPELAEPPSESDRARMKTGQEVGAIARRREGDGAWPQGQGGDALSLAEATRLLMETPTPAIFEAAFVAEGLTARVDILRREGDGWRIVEVKSSQSVKNEQIPDIAFQWRTLELAGVRLTGASIVIINRDYTLQGDLDPHQFLVEEDVTKQVLDALASVKQRSGQILEAMQEPEQPGAMLNTWCRECPFVDACWPEIPDDDILCLTGIQNRTVTKFRSAGINHIQDLPASELKKPQWQRAAESLRTRQPVVTDGLADALQQIQEPISFVDFETTRFTIPWIQGQGPGLLAAFQWSCHIYEGGQWRHEEFLFEEAADPTPDFCESLAGALVGSGSIVHYSTHEVTCLRDFSRRGVPWAKEALDAFESRGVDLLELLRAHVYLADFRGSFSIKTTLPALVPGLSYEKMEIKDGGMAELEWQRMISGVTVADEKARISRALKAYCELDTWAMAQVWEAIRALA